MKKLKTYKLFTESITDLMIPRSKDDIKKELMKLEPIDRLEKIISQKMINIFTNKELKNLINLIPLLNLQITSAIKLGFNDLAEKLINSPSRKDRFHVGRYSLELCIDNNNDKIFNLIISKYYSEIKKNSLFIIPNSLDRAIGIGYNNINIIKTIMDYIHKELNKTQQKNYLDIGLNRAIQNADVEMVKFLLSYPIDDILLNCIDSAWNNVDRYDQDEEDSKKYLEITKLLYNDSRIQKKLKWRDKRYYKKVLNK